MGPVKEWLMTMEEDSHYMTNEELTKKHGRLNVEAYLNYKQLDYNDWYETPDEESLNKMPSGLKIDEPPF
jgi:hypothetical protein